MSAMSVDGRQARPDAAGDATPGGAPGELPPRARGSLARQVARARLWLPLAIVGVVLVWELLVVPAFSPQAQFWLELLFYTILGPTATFVTLHWIVQEVVARERAQRELADTYRQLRSSHALLSAIQRVTERFAAARDLEAAISAAARGIREVTGSKGAAVLIGARGAELVEHEGLDELLQAWVRQRDAELRSGAELTEVVETPEGRRWILSEAMRGEGEVGGSLHAVFHRAPDERQREAFGILAGEFSAVAEASRMRMRDLLTLFEVDRSIRAEGNLERLLEALLDQMMTRAGAARGAVYVADASPVLRAQVVRGAAAAPTVRLGEGWLGGAAERGEAELRPTLEPSETADGLLSGAGSAVALPLMAERELLGMVVLAHEAPDHLDRSQLPFLNLVAGQVSLALRNARAYLYSEELAIGEERGRIAREIHDGVAQSLAFTALKADLAARFVRSDPERAERELATVKEGVRESIKEVRRSIFALRPVDLERHGFRETMRRYLDDFGQQNDVRVEFEVGPLPELDLRSEAVLFRIFQEAMHNVAKHAAAGNVWVSVGTARDGLAYVRVQDDGLGFDPSAVADRVTSAGGLGLRQMRERVEDRGGRFEVLSTPGEGTRVEAAVP